MSSIKALQQQIDNLRQQRGVHEKELSKHHRQGISNLTDGNPMDAMGEEQTAHKEKQRIDTIDQQIQKLQNDLTQLQNQLTNVEAKMTERKNQHLGDQQRLEQQFQVEMQQLESEHARILG